jgi:TadE-like protein
MDRVLAKRKKPEGDSDGPWRAWLATERRSRARKREPGYSLIGLALLIPLLLIVVAGIIQIGQLAYFNIAVTDAARAGVVYGAQSHSTAADEAGMAAAAENNAAGIRGMTVTAGHFCQCAGTGASDAGCLPNGCPDGRPILYVRVVTQARVNTIFGLPSKTYTAKGNAVMRVEQ